MSCSSSRNLPHLPQDIIDAIFYLHAHDRAQLLLWSLLSPLYRVRSQKLLFNSVEIHSRSPGISAMLADAVVANPVLAAYIHSLTIVCGQLLDNFSFPYILLVKLYRVKTVALYFETHVQAVLPMTTFLTSVFDLMRRCRTTALQVTSRYGFPVPWIAGLGYLERLTLHHVGCTYSAFKDLEEHCLPEAIRSTEEQALDRAVHAQLRKLIADYPPSYSDPSFANVLRLVDKFCLERSTAPPGPRLCTSPCPLAIITHLDVDEDSAESLVLIIFQSTSAYTACTFRFLESLTFLGQTDDMIRLAQFICNNAQTALKSLQWRFLEDTSGLLGSPASPRLIIPPHVDSVNFNFPSMCLPKEDLEHIAGAIAPLLSRSDLPRMTISIHVYSPYDACQALLDEEIVHKLVHTLRSVSYDAGQQDAIRIRWVPADSDADTDAFRTFQDQMALAWNEAWL